MTKESKSKFVHLHVHSSYSIKDGVGKIDEYIEKVKADGQSALALTEHGNMYSHIQFHDKAKAAGIKPIIGIEAYICNDHTAHSKDDSMWKRSYHLTLLAETQEGYDNLKELLSIANKKGFYYNPRIDKVLLKKYSKGLICLSGCLGGELSQSLIHEDIEHAEKTIEEFIAIFGRENFFIEIMNHGNETEEEVRKILPKLAKKHNVKIVATNDIHYCNKEDKVVQDAVIAMRDHTTLDDPELRRYKENEYYVKTQEEMYALFPDNPEYLQNSQDIADRCNVNIKFDKVIFPEFIKGKDKKKELLRDLCLKGWQKYIKPLSLDKKTEKIYSDRVKYELDVINENNFADYFLFVQDIVNYAKEKEIPMSPGRGSVGGSLVSHILGITDLIDPIKYGLYFERFLNPSRISPPDIDLDFADSRREEIIQYTREKYGEENFAKTITFGNFQPKQALRMSFKVYGYDMDVQNTHAKMVPDTIQGLPEIRFRHLLGNVPEFPHAEVPDLVAAKEKYPEVFFLAEKLEGNPSNTSTHASSYIVTDVPISKYVPLDYDSRNNAIRIGVDMYSAEKAKLLKMDYLGIETLTIVENATRLIKERHDINIDKRKLPLDDQKTWDLISKGDTIGIFQFESDGMRALLRKAKPRSIEELADCNAIYRPGAAKFIDEYCATKAGIKEAEPIHPLMEPVLKETYGVLIYQEQVMKMCQVLAGFTLPEADYMRKAIGKKKEEDMKKLMPMFEKGCLKNDIDKDIVAKILDWFHDMSRYNFNKSHALGYSLNAYYSAYIKANYPTEFAAAMLNKKTKELSDYLTRFHDAKKRGIKIHGPNINESKYTCSLKGDEIYFGLNQIKGTTGPTIKKILEERKANGPFKSYEELFTRCYQYIDKKTIEGFINSGALDSIGVVRKWAMENAEEQVNFFKKARKSDERQIDLFGETEIITAPKELFTVPKGATEFERSILLAREKIVLGFYASGSPLDPYRKTLYEDDFSTTSQVINQEGEHITLGGIIRSIRRIKDKNQNLMAFFEVEDDVGTARCVAFHKKYNTNKAIIREDYPVKIKGMVSNGSIMVNSIKKLEV